MNASQMGQKRSAAWGKLTPEERSALGEKRRAKMTPKERTAISEWIAKCSPEQRSVIAQKAANSRKAKYSPEERTAWAKKAAAALTPEKHRETGKKVSAHYAHLKAKAARLDAIENAAVTPTKRGRPGDEVAAAFYAAFVAAGSPSNGDTILKIAKPFYPQENSKAEKLPKWRAREIKRLRIKLDREGKK